MVNKSYICSNQDFLHRSVLLTRKLLNQGFIETWLRSTCTLTKCFGCYHHLTLLYRVSVITMANDICTPCYCCHEYIVFLDTTSWRVPHAEQEMFTGAPGVASGFYRGSRCPVICVSLFHVIVLSFGFWVLIVHVWLRGIYMFYLLFMFADTSYMKIIIYISLFT